MSDNKLDTENFKKGFLVDENFMAGVSSPEQAGKPFTAFVLSQMDGQYVHFTEHTNLNDALDAINRIERDWTYEAVSGCGNGQCGAGKCDAGNCKVAINSCSC